MPRVVDHDAKRKEVVSLATEMIARDGIDKVSLREIAEAADASTAIVSHYFSAKVELLLHTYRASLQESQRRQCNVTIDGREGLVALSAQILPLDEERQTIWRLSIAFMAMALNDPVFGKEWENNLRSARGRIEDALEAMVEKGDARRDLDVGAAARALMSLIRGISTEAMISSEDWPPERQLQILESGMDMLLEHRQTKRRSTSRQHPRSDAALPTPSRRSTR